MLPQLSEMASEVPLWDCVGVLNRALSCFRVVNAPDSQYYSATYNSANERPFWCAGHWCGLSVQSGRPTQAQFVVDVASVVEQQKLSKSLVRLVLISWLAVLVAFPLLLRVCIVILGRQPWPRRQILRDELSLH